MIWIASAIGLERGARLVAVAVVPLLLPDRTDPRWSLLFAGLAVYVLLTALTRRVPVLRAADIAVAAIVIAASGGQVAPFLLFLIVAVAGPAAKGGIRAGLAAGSVLSFVLLFTLAVYGELPELGLGGILPAVLLLPLVGITTATAVQVLEQRSDHDRRMLEEANRLLSSLRAIADDLPGGLDASTVAAAVIAELRTIEGARAVLVLADEHGVLQPAGASGVEAHRVSGLRVDQARQLARRADGQGEVHAQAALPDALRQACTHLPHWAVLTLGGGDDVLGALLVGFEEEDAARDAWPRLESVAVDAALALENARLFDGTLARAAATARRHIAGDLHDGVAQSLAHLRMELELLAMASDEPDGGELGRLARVSRSALEDLRSTIDGLRRPVGGDLEARLARHIADVQPVAGPRLELDIRGAAPLHPEGTEDVLRIAQEAVSNALRHARASAVTVTLDSQDETLSLRIEDDGVGITPADHRSGGGVGLRSMRERAERLGGDLAIRPRPGGGTLVALRCPIAQPRSPARTGR